MSIKRFCFVACSLLLTLLWAVLAAPASPPIVSSAPLLTPTHTATPPPPTPTSCPNSYNYTVSTGTIVSGTTLLPGSQCGVCVVNVALPFPFSYYGQTYTSANLSTQGNLQFTTTHLGQNTCPLPEPLLGPAMMPHWDESLETSYHGPCQAAMGSPCGIYASVSGSAPNRIFKVEWRAHFFGTSHHTANFEIRLYENSTYFEYVYGWVSYFGSYASIGVQDGGCRFTTYSCNTWDTIQPGTRIGWGGPPSTTPTPTTQPTITPTIGPPCGILTFGNPGTTYCTSPTSYFYSFTFYVESGCPSSMNGTATVDYEVAPDSSGPWTVYDTQMYPVTFQRGWNGSTGTFEEPGIPSQHQWYRISYVGRFPNNVNAYAVTNPARRCDVGTVTPTTITPTPTCCNNVTGNISSACQGTSYRFTFGLTNSCSITTTANGGLFFEVSPNSTGPWTSPIHGDYFNYQIPPGYREESGSLWSGTLPPGNNWFRYRLYMIGSCWTVNVASTPQPACVTGTPGTVTPTGTPCPQNYVYATATATIVPGTTDIGNHCDDCSTKITLPFSYQLYDQSFTSVTLESNGSAAFFGSIPIFPISCFPVTGVTYIVFPYRDDLRTDCAGCGIFTSTSGTAPNRIFNIEWRTTYFSGGGTANFELRLYEGQTRFDVIYGVTGGNTGVLAGVQKNSTYWTQYFCNGQGGDANNGRLVIYTLPGCGTVTPGPTSTGPPAVTHTATSTATATPTQCALYLEHVASPNNGQTSVLRDVDTLSSTHAWAVGIGTNDSSLTMRWDGAQWIIVPSPSLGSGTTLHAVDTLSATDAWAVGYWDSPTTPQQTMIQHWDGTQWSVVSSPSPGNMGSVLYDVAAVSANDVWAVGTQKNSSSVDNTLILHWDGTQWSMVPSPNVGTGANELHAISVVGPNDIWAAGLYYDNLTARNLFVHWDGTQWTVVPGGEVPTASLIQGLDAVSPTDVWAVGRYLVGSTWRTLVMRWNGTQWSQIPSPSPSNSANELRDISVVSGSDAWAVGYWSNNGVITSLVVHWNGNEWSTVPATGFDGQGSLHAVHAVESGVWAIGSAPTGVGNYSRTLTLRGGIISCPTVSPTRTPTTAPPTLTPTSTATSCSNTFTDVPPTHTFYSVVQCLACRGIVSGYSDGTFRPNNPVTRGQLAKIVSGAAGFNEPVSTQTFEDVTPANTFYEWIERLTTRGYMTGYLCGGPGEPCTTGRPYFRPFANATRGQTSKIVANAAMFTEPPVGQTFEDVPTTHTFYEFVQRLATRNVMQGYLCGGPGEPCISGRPYFRPGNDVTRGQSAKIVANTFFPNCEIRQSR